jgi:hypothetical protein
VLSRYGCQWDPSKDMPQSVLNAVKAYTYAPQFVEVSMFPQTAFKQNLFYTIAKAVFALFFVLSYLFPASRLIRALVVEKETKVRRCSPHVSCTPRRRDPLRLLCVRTRSVRA